jgi:hypothetical protein
VTISPIGCLTCERNGQGRLAAPCACAPQLLPPVLVCSQSQAHSIFHNIPDWFLSFNNSDSRPPCLLLWYWKCRAPVVFALQQVSAADRLSCGAGGGREQAAPPTLGTSIYTLWCVTFVDAH